MASKTYSAVVGVNVANSMGELNPTIVETQYALAQQLMLPIRSLIQWVSDQSPGLTRNVVGMPSLSMSAITFTSATATADASVAFDTTQRQTTISSKGIDLIIHLDTMLGGVGDIEGGCADSMAKASQKKLETDLMALYTESNTDIGGSGTPITYQTTFTGALELLAQNAAAGQKSWIIPSTQISSFMTDSTFADWHKSNLNLLNQDIAMTDGYLGVSPAGVSCFWSNNYTTATGEHGIMFSRDAIRLTERLPFTITKIDSELLGGERALKISCTHTYGINGIRGASATANPWIVDTIS